MTQGSEKVKQGLALIIDGLMDDAEEQIGRGRTLPSSRFRALDEYITKATTYEVSQEHLDKFARRYESLKSQNTVST